MSSDEVDVVDHVDVAVTMAFTVVVAAVVGVDSFIAASGERSGCCVANTFRRTLC